MNAIPSAEFRTKYAKLIEPTVVTVNGHAIGLWTPATGAVSGTVEETHIGPAGETVIDKMVLREVAAPRVDLSAQAQRDKLLGKINRPRR